MSGAYNKQDAVDKKWLRPREHGGWKVVEKRSSGSQFERYDTQICVIVGKSKKPTHLYLSKLAMEKLGDPEYIVAMKDGTELAFFATDKEDPNGYKVVRTEGSRPFVNCRAVIVNAELRSGVYTGHLWESPPNVAVVINTTSKPSEI